MANVFVPSANDPAVFTSDKFPLIKDADGNTYRTVVKANVNGSIDVFSKGTGLLGSDQLLFQYSATRNAADFTEGIFKDKPTTAFNSFFRGTGSNGTQFLTDAKTKWYQEAPPNASARLAGLVGYQAIAATTQRRTQSTGAGGALTIQTSQGPLTVSPPTTGDPAPAATGPQASEVEAKDISATISDGYVRRNYGADPDLRYPENLRLEIQDCIQFKMFRYGARSIDASSPEKALNLRLPDRILTPINGTVTLPIQPSISDSNGVEWGGANLNPADAYFASLARGAMEGEGSAADVIAGLAARVSGDLKKAAQSDDIKNAVLTYLTQEAVGVQGLLSRTSGAILNPNLELLFNGPTLRSFNFTFRLSPRSKTEATNVRRIIRFFKQGMSVKTSPTNIFLKAPNVFEIKYLAGGRQHPSLNRIKKCALLSCDVDYTPDGTYMTFNDEDKNFTMTSYQMSLRFSELDPIYEDDYNKDGLSEQDTQIGY